MPFVIPPLPWKLIGISAIAFAFLTLFFHDRMVVAQNDKLKTQIVANKQAYEQAQKDAAQQNQVEVKRIEGKYAANNEKAKNDYQTDLARVRAEFERLHRKAAPGASGSAGSPTAPAAPGGIDGAATVPVPADLLLYGAEIELRLLHLQRLVRKQVEAGTSEEHR